MENLFELAVRGKIRFNFRGLISAEDLWDLTVEQLDSIFRSLNSELKELETDSLLQAKTLSSKTLSVKIDIIKYIVSQKLKEEEVRQSAVERKQKREKLLTIIESKEDEELKGSSINELRALLEEL